MAVHDQALRHWASGRARQCMQAWHYAAALRTAMRWAKGHALEWYAAQLQRKVLLSFYDRVLVHKERTYVLSVALTRTAMRQLCSAFDSW